MSHFHNNALVGASGQGGGYNIESSLRFRSSASAYLSRTPASAGNRRTWTWSAWVKRGVLPTNYQTVFDATNSGNVYQVFRFIDYQFSITMDNTYGISTNAVFRDPSAWYHIVVVNDTTQATDSNRIKIYVNGVQQSTYFWYGTWPSQNFEGNVNSANQHSFGRYIYGNTYYFDGYLTELNLIDGQALTPSDFGETDEDTGVWKPKAYTGTYGTNGFYLDGSGVTDGSGNGNNWTNNNLNLSNSALTTYDLMNDVPTLTNEDTSNFCTYNSAHPLTSGLSSMTNGNLTISYSAEAWRHGVSTFILPKSGKWYFEVSSGADNNNQSMGIVPVNSLSNGTNAYRTDAILTNFPNQTGTAGGGLAGSTVNWTGTYNISAGDIVACAIDVDANKVWFRIGANWVDAGSGAGDPSAGTNPAVSGGINTSKDYNFVTSVWNNTHNVNFGQRPFAYTPPTGFKKLNTYNLPDSNVLDGSQHFFPKLYTGTGSTLTVTGLEFSPDWVWIKQRGKADYHQAFDTIRGVSKNLSINQTVAEQDSGSTGLTAFNSDGFTLGTWNNLNQSGIATVAWCWRGSDSAAVTNTDGTITTTVSANLTAGFSIVKFTGNGSANATTGHGLGGTPDLIIHKRTDTSKDWLVSGYGGTGLSSVFTADNQFLLLNGTTAKLSAASNTLEAQSTTIKHRVNGTNASGSTNVMYCFKEVEGFSKFGSYTGNGSSDGPFVYTGFRPAFVMIKRSDSGTPWYMWDSSRNTYNITNLHLYANQSNTEVTENNIDLVSNGFKWRNSISDGNANGGTFIYMAFAENPFKNSLAR